VIVWGKRVLQKGSAKTSQKASLPSSLVLFTWIEVDDSCSSHTGDYLGRNSITQVPVNLLLSSI
jgi:hypothetical protein